MFTFDCDIGVSMSVSPLPSKRATKAANLVLKERWMRRFLLGMEGRGWLFVIVEKLATHRFRNRKFVSSPCEISNSQQLG